MRNKLFIGLVGCILLSLTAFPALGEVKTLEMVAAEDMPPAFVKDQGDGYLGLYVEIYQAICKKAGFEAKITYQPWIRAQETASKGNNLVIMAMARTPERESKYMWICKVYYTDWAFATTNGKVYDLQSAKALNSILIQTGTPVLEILTKAGFSNLETVSANMMNAKKLAAGRGDAWATPIMAGKWIWKREGLPGKLTFGPVIYNNEQWMCMSPGSDQALADALKKGLDAIKADGSFNKIVDRYY